MLVIVRNSTRKRAAIGFRVLVALLLFTLIISHLYNMYNGKDVIREGWLRDDRPSGNPMRVENVKETGQESNPGLLSEFVVKIKDLYRKDQ